ncbi:MAG: translocation protein TolB, partial [Gimesia sp.]
MRPVFLTSFICIICFIFFSSESIPLAADEKPKVKRTRFYLATPEGKNPKVYHVAKDYYNTGSPVFSPDGSKLAYDGWKSQDGESFSNVQILVANADGSDQKIIGPGAMPSWSPGGNRIAFSQLSPYGVAIMNADGSDPKLIDSGGWGAQWSPDGKKIAYRSSTSGKANLRIYDLIEDTKSDLFPDGESPYSAIYWNMTWSPDSNWVCFLGRRAEDKMYEVATVNVAGMEEGYKVHFKSKVSPYQDMAWHPQGDMIVFGSPGSPRKLLKFNPADDKAPEPLEIEVDGNINGGVTFTPDGQHLLFNARDK